MKFKASFISSRIPLCLSKNAFGILGYVTLAALIRFMKDWFEPNYSRTLCLLPEVEAYGKFKLAWFFFCCSSNSTLSFSYFSNLACISAIVGIGGSLHLNGGFGIPCLFTIRVTPIYFYDGYWITFTGALGHFDGIM